MITTPLFLPKLYVEASPNIFRTMLPNKNILTKFVRKKMSRENKASSNK